MKGEHEDLRAHSPRIPCVSQIWPDLTGHDLAVIEALQTGHHRCQRSSLHTTVDVQGLLEHHRLAEPLGQDVHVREVSCLGPIEERHELSSGKLFGSERGPQEADARRTGRRGVHGEVNE